MHSTSVPAVIALILSGFFALAALINFAAPRFVRETYHRWYFGPAFHWIAGFANLAAAALLAMPVTRLWGVVIAAPVMFVAETMLISHKHYGFAVPGAVVLAALVPALLAGPL